MPGRKATVPFLTEGCAAKEENGTVLFKVMRPGKVCRGFLFVWQKTTGKPVGRIRMRRVRQVGAGTGKE